MATKKTDSKGLVIQTLVIKPNTRSALDVGQWRTALKAADKGKREKLYDLYEDITLDLVLSDAIDKRIDAITNAELTFTRNEQPVPEIDMLMDTPEWEEILREIMLTKFWGKTVIEFDFTDGLKPYSIPRKHIRPDLGIIVVNPSDETGTPYRGDDFFLEVGKDTDLGLLLKLAPMAIYKRGGYGDWAQFIEIFGMPQRIGKYNSHDDESRKILEQALENSGSAPWLVVPKETDIETKESTSFSNALMHEKFKASCNEEMLIGVLGQTMTTLNGSSRSQSETHKEVEEGKNKSDRRFVQRILNHLLLPMLEKRGYPVSGGFFFFAEAGETLTMEQQMNIHTRFVNELGLEIEEEWLYENYSVPKPKGGAKAKPKKEEKPKDSKTDGEEQKFWERVFSFFLKAPAEMGAQSQQVCAVCGGTHHFNLNFNPNFDNESLLKRVASGESDYFDSELFSYTASAIRDGLNSGFLSKKFTDFEYGFEPDALKTAMELNIFHFSASKTLVEVQKLNELWRVSESFDDFRKKAEDVTQVFNKAWLQTEYETAYLTAESSATYYRLMEQTDIFPYWEYVTVGDDKVRQEHRALSGLVLPASDAIWDKIYPPNGWRCRCRVKPVMKHEADRDTFDANRLKAKEYFKSSEWKKNEQQGFGVNRAKLGYIFDANNMYIKKFPDVAKKRLGNLFYNSWNIDEFAKRLARATVDMPAFTGKPDEWLKANAALTDYNGRKISINQKSFRHHTTGSRENRSELLEALKDVLANPDEVWINDYDTNLFNNFVTIKYYNGKAIAVVSKITRGKVYEVETWFQIEQASTEKRWLKNPKYKYRRGLLVFYKK